MDKWLSLLYEGTDYIFNVMYYKLYWSQDPQYQFRIYDFDGAYSLYQKDGVEPLIKGDLLTIDNKLEELWQKMKADTKSEKESSSL